MRAILILACAVLLAGCATPIGGAEWSASGVKFVEHPDGKVEVIVAGSHHKTYRELAAHWKRMADEYAHENGARSYDIVWFSTGREVQGLQVVPEGSVVERFSEDALYWLPRAARGVITLN